MTNPSTLVRAKIYVIDASNPHNPTMGKFGIDRKIFNDTINTLVDATPFYQNSYIYKEGNEQYVITFNTKDSRSSTGNIKISNKNQGGYVMRKNIEPLIRDINQRTFHEHKEIMGYYTITHAEM